MKEQPISIRLLTKADFNVIEAAFKKQGWHKPASQFEQYALEQDNEEK